MKTSYCSAALLASLAWHALPAAAQPTLALPAAVRQAVDSNRQTCREERAGTLIQENGALQQADLNGDGLPDFVYDESKIRCSRAGSMFGGTGGSTVTVFAGGRKGISREAFSSGAFGAKIVNGRLFVAVGGELCGQNTRNRPNTELESCIRPLKWNARQERFDFAPLSQKRPLPKNWN